jgi:3-dehydroquinate synthase II
MKKIWVKADPWEKELVTAALECGADAVIVPEDRVDDVRALGVIKTVSVSGDLKWESDVVCCELHGAEDEETIVRLSREKIVVVRTSDWRVIPLENLAARTGNIFVEVENMDEAQVANGVLEKGVDGLVVVNRDPVVVREILGKMKGVSGRVDLCTFSIEEMRPVGMGDRVCVDTCTIMSGGEGILVGNSTQALFLVQAENVENPYAAVRPFRVNAGPVHAYVLLPEGRTRYLSEIRSGDPVLGVNWRGESRPLVVGRAKVERRPLVLVTAKGAAGDPPEARRTIILQNAETIRLVRPGGEAVSVAALKPGDEVLGHAESPGRHFGHKIQETILEK